MSSFLNNYTKVLPLEVAFGADENTLKPSILAAIRGILESDVWTTTPDDSIIISVLTGGITNILYLVHNTVADHKVVVRVFGAGTSDFIDRDHENIVFAKLSALNLGPAFYGLFENGRIEGYIHARALLADEMSLPLIYPTLAGAVCNLHNQSVPEIGTDEQWLWNKTRLFFDLCKDYKFSDPARQTLFEELDMTTVLEKFNWMVGVLSANERKLKPTEHTTGTDTIDRDTKESRSYLLGRLFGYSRALCHNDLLSGNVLLSLNSDETAPSHTEATTAEPEKSLKNRSVTIIDYEYASYNYRAFDLANHFNENCGFAFDIVNNFPTREHRVDFIRYYLKAVNKDCVEAMFHDDMCSEEFAAGFEATICDFTLASHMMWGAWSVVQANISSVDFDYLGYAKLRFAGFDHHKQLFSVGDDGVERNPVRFLASL